MPWFIKIEKFTPKTLELSVEDRKVFIDQHKSWVKKLKAMGKRISSGYLVDQNKTPGGGGVLIIKADSYEQAISIVHQDPMISKGLVTWELQEWIPIAGDFEE